jgi:phosphate starvation-inducible membrane PsiE
MARTPAHFAIRMLVFVGILVVLNLIFMGAGIHEHINILGSVVLTLVLTVIMYALYAMKSR